MVHRRKKWQRKRMFGTPMHAVACPKLLNAMSPIKRNAHEALERYMDIRLDPTSSWLRSNTTGYVGGYVAFRKWRADWLRQCLIYGPKWHMDALRHRAREEIAGADAYSVVSGLRDVL